MQGNHDDLNGEIEWREDRLDQIAREERRLRAEVNQLREEQRVEHMTPDERRADIRRRNMRGVRKILEAVGALSLAEFLRSHRRAAVASAMAAGAAGAVAVAPGSTDLLDLAPDEPPSIVATPSPRVADPDAHPKGGGGVVSPSQPAPGGPPGDDAPERSGSGEPPGEGVPEPALSSAAATTPPPQTTQPPPAPPDEPSPEPQPSPTSEPTSTATPQPPSPVPTATAAPPTATASPDGAEPLLCVELEEVVGACVDVPVVGDLIDGLLPSRYRVR